ncbi:unnamed protein product [Penicillium pancosmium]
MTIGSQDQGATGAAKWVTSTLGNTVGGVTRTVGGVTGAATRGVGDTINSATGSAGRPVGDAIGNAGTGLEDGTKQVAKGVENAGEWKGQWRRGDMLFQHDEYLRTFTALRGRFGLRLLSRKRELLVEEVVDGF